MTLDFTEPCCVFCSLSLSTSHLKPQVSVGKDCPFFILSTHKAFGKTGPSSRWKFPVMIKPEGGE